MPDRAPAPADVEAIAEVRHDPTNYSTGRHGCWVHCTCGWRSATWTTIAAAYANFGRHLVLVDPTTKEATDD